MLLQSTYSPFVSEVSLLCVQVLLELSVFLIDGVVCQMRVDILFHSPHVIRLTCKSRQAVIININSERIYACYQYVDPQVELNAVYQQRILNILTDHQLLIQGNLRDLVNDEYAHAL